MKSRKYQRLDDPRSMYPEHLHHDLYNPSTFNVQLRVDKHCQNSFEPKPKMWWLRLENCIYIIVRLQWFCIHSQLSSFQHRGIFYPPFPLSDSPNDACLGINIMNILSRLQLVRELRQLFEHPSSDHPISSSLGCTWTRPIVWISLVWSSHPSPSFVCRGYVKIVNCLNTSNLSNLLQLILIFLSQPLQGVRELGQLFEYLSLIRSSYIILSRLCVNFWSFFWILVV